MQKIGHPKTAVETEASSPYRDRDQLRFLIIGGAFSGDIVVIWVAALMASWLRFGDFVSGNALDLLVVVLFPYVLAALVVEAFGIDSLRKKMTSVRRAVMAIMISFAVAVIAAFAFKVTASYSRLETGYLVIISIFGLILWRSAFSSIINHWFLSITEPVVVILGDFSGLADERLRKNGTKVIDVGERGWTIRYDDPDFLNRVSDEIGNSDRLVLAFGDDRIRHEWVELSRIMGIRAEVWQSNLTDTQALGLDNLSGWTTLVVSRGPLRFYERFTKRAFDFGLTVPVLVLLSPLMVILAILIKIDSPGPAFFIQERVGAKNRVIPVYKFRTMCDAAENDGQSTSKHDRRITKLGSVLRRFSLDELPQLFNVLKGEMSLVGPRPHAVGSKAGGELFWDVANDYWSRHAVKPGLTGLAQIRGYRGGAISKEDLNNRVLSDLEYLNSWSIGLDASILIRTAKVIFHQNAY